MIYRAVITALAAGVAVVSLADQADAGHRKRYYGYESYYPGPLYSPPPRYYRYSPPPGYMTREEYEELYGDDFDNGYYDPYFDPPRKVKPLKKKAAKASKRKTAKSHKPAKSKTATSSKTEKSVKTVAKPSPNTEAAVKTTAPTALKMETPSKTATPTVKTETPPKTTTQTAAKETAPKAKAGALSCDKAGSIISGYGFTDIKASSCAGEFYAFNATRDGKSYAVKLNAANGELTEVRKVR